MPYNLKYVFIYVTLNVHITYIFQNFKLIHDRKVSINFLGNYMMKILN